MHPDRSSTRLATYPAVFGLCVGWLCASLVLAYEIPWSSVDGGGQRAQSSQFELRGTVGQSDAGSVLESSSFALRGGLHRQRPTSPLPDPVFANSFE